MSYEEAFTQSADTKHLQPAVNYHNQPDDFERLSKTMTESFGKAEQALKEKGTLPEIQIVDQNFTKNGNLTPEEILKYGKTAAKDLNDTARALLDKATGVFSPDAQTANRIELRAKEIIDGPRWYTSDHDERNPDRTSKAAEDRALGELTPEQRKQYEKEKKMVEAWELDERMSMRIRKPGEHDERPATPMIDRVNHRCREIIKHAHEQVMNDLTPQERQKLLKEEGDFARKIHDQWRRLFNQEDVPSLSISVPPKLGPMHQEIEDRVARRIESGR